MKTIISLIRLIVGIDQNKSRPLVHPLEHYVTDMTMVVTSHGDAFNLSEGDLFDINCHIHGSDDLMVCRVVQIERYEVETFYSTISLACIRYLPVKRWRERIK